MKFILRIKNLVTSFFEDFVSSKETQNPRLLIESTLREYAKKQAMTRKSLTSLVFYKKQLEEKLKKAEGLTRFYQEKVEQLARENKDEEALALMEKMESLHEEKAFIQGQMDKLILDVDSAKKMENELKVKMVLAREKMEVLSGRVEALKLRKNLKESLNSISAGTKNFSADSKIQKLEKEVFKLELENTDFAESADLDSEFEQWSLSKNREDLNKKLVALKEKLVKPVEIKKIDYICT
ncbi:MAG: phage shock protein A [Bacteriovoracaceae bacterium]|jgi:phage shock protein A